MHITLESRAQHDTLSKKGIVIFDDNDATGLDNQVIDRSGLYPRYHHSADQNTLKYQAS